MQNRKNEIAGLLTEILCAVVYCAAVFGFVLIAAR